ncbi:S24 family peptidase [Sphingomonas baiyangensis]|nr:LexA family transcriptional regulator [Sphingomonas baiyangensis]
MSERSDRLKQAFKRAKLKPTEAAERWGWNYNTLKSNLNGSVDFSYRAALKYGGRLKVRAEWLYDGAEPMQDFVKPPPSLVEVPVISWVSAGQISDVGQVEDISELERITVEGLGPGQFVATDVRGDSMDRVSPEGSRIIFNVHDRDPIAGGYYVFSLRGETTYKRYYDQPVQRLEPYSTNPANRPIYLMEDGWSVVGRVVRSLIDLD